MRFSSDGTHLLGGVGNGQVYLDGLSIASHAGGWAWVTAQTIMGPGGYDSAQSGLYAYDLPTGPTRFTGDKHLATNFYGNGGGAWLLYLADGRTGSTDSSGNNWPSRVALGFIGKYQIFTDTSWVPIIFRDITNGSEYTTPNPDEWAPLPDGSSWFSRNYRGVFRSTIFYACGYSAAYGGLCVWQPFNAGSPAWLLSGDGHDFNPDIAARTDGLLVVGSGINQGETGQRLYELHLSAQIFRVNGGAWQPLKQAMPPASDPIVAIGRPVWQGFIEFGPGTTSPQNCYVYITPIGSQPDPAFRAYVRAAGGIKLYRYVQAASDSDVNGLEAAIAKAKAEEPSMPVMAYWTMQAQAIRVPKGADAVLVEGYWKVVETLSQLEQRIRTNMARHPHSWVGAQCYTSNPSNQTNLEAVVPVYARILRDMGDGCLAFSDGNRATGWTDHPEVHDDWQTLAAGIPSAPPLPQPPNPQPTPPDPTPVPPDPVPPQPIPIPPQPQEPDDMLYTKSLLTDMLQGTLVPNGSNWAIKKPNGKYVCVTPDGAIEERDAAASWESFRKSGAFLVADRDGGRTYAFGLVE